MLIFLRDYYYERMTDSVHYRHCGLDPQSPKRKGFVFALRRWQILVRHDDKRHKKVFYCSPSALYSSISPGVHCNSRQMALRVLRRMALALPVFNMERLACVRPIFSANSLERILRVASITSKFKIIMTQTVRLFSSTASAATLYMKAKKSRKKGVTKLVCWS